MIQRCENENNPSYPSYGGRGICVCHRFRKSVQAFCDDMGPRPSPQHSLDRRDNNGHYSCGKCEECLRNRWPANCRWATRREQHTNTRANVRITVDRVTKTVAEWEEEAGLGKGTISGRLLRGWPPEKAVHTPPGASSRKWRLITVNGTTKTLAGWARASGLKRSTISQRLRRNWPPERAVSVPPGARVDSP
jgi:hypothetical protein